MCFLVFLTLVFETPWVENWRIGFSDRSQMLYSVGVLSFAEVADFEEAKVNDDQWHVRAILT